MQRRIATPISIIRNAPREAVARTAALCILAVVAALVTMVGPGPSLTHASDVSASRPDAGPIGTQPYNTAPAEQAGVQTIWTGNLKVGKASDLDETYLGYSPNLAPSEQGDLDVKEFEHDGVQYSILGIFQQEFGPTFKQLIFSADIPLPDDWVFAFGDKSFPLSDAADLGSGQNIHAWRLAEVLGWSEGETVTLSLVKPSQSIVSIDPALNADPEEFMLGVIAMSGEIAESRQFIPINITLEDGKSYVVEMKGAATDDGTLSDPWISGINGRFETDGQRRWEPVWYDASGRTSTDVTFSNGSSYRVDENGRMFFASTRNGEETLSPVTGGNDDGGEGFNAKLFLVNFPSGDYQVVVSGAPNPNDTGTFTFDLMEITVDDHSGDPRAPGALLVGGSAFGNIERPGDTDWFAVELEDGVDYAVEIQGEASEAGELPEPRVAGIYDDIGTLIDDTGNNHLPPRISGGTRVAFTPQTNGTHYIAVSGYTPYMPHLSTLPVGTYTVSVNVQQ